MRDDRGGSTGDRPRVHRNDGDASRRRVSAAEGTRRTFGPRRDVSLGVGGSTGGAVVVPAIATSAETAECDAPARAGPNGRRGGRLSVQFCDPTTSCCSEPAVVTAYARDAIRPANFTPPSDADLASAGAEHASILVPRRGGHLGVAEGRVRARGSDAHDPRVGFRGRERTGERVGAVGRGTRRDACEFTRCVGRRRDRVRRVGRRRDTRGMERMERIFPSPRRTRTRTPTRTRPSPIDTSRRAPRPHRRRRRRVRPRASSIGDVHAPARGVSGGMATCELPAFPPSAVPPGATIRILASLRLDGGARTLAAPVGAAVHLVAPDADDATFRLASDDDGGARRTRTVAAPPAAAVPARMGEEEEEESKSAVAGDAEGGAVVVSPRAAEAKEAKEAKEANGANGEDGENGENGQGS